MNKNIITPLLTGAMLFSLSAVETGNRIPARGLALDKPGSDFRVVDFTRDALGPKDILIEIDYSGICHSDIHSALNEHAAPGSEPQFPIIPGHEMAGHVVQVGADVKKFAVGDLAGVGCFVDSCGECRECRRGLEQFCEVRDPVPNLLKDGRNFRGGYSNRIVVPERNAIKIPAGAGLQFGRRRNPGASGVQGNLPEWDRRQGEIPRFIFPLFQSLSLYAEKFHPCMSCCTDRIPSPNNLFLLHSIQNLASDKSARQSVKS